MTELRKAFHEELDDIAADVARLGALAADSIAVGTEAFLAADLAAAEGVVVNDAVLDELMHSIESRAFVLLARQQPMALDLRTLVTVLRIVHELERVGDLMVNVAKAARRLYPYELDTRTHSLITRMGAQAVAQVKVAVDAFAHRDPARAAALGDMDDTMDDLQKDLFRAIFSSGADDEASVQRAVQLALVGRYYERIADHAVNTGERVQFMVTGHMVDEPQA